MQSEEAGPELVKERLPTKDISFISQKAIDEFFDFVGYGTLGFELYKSKVGTFVFGKWRAVNGENRLEPSIRFTTHDKPIQIPRLTNVVQVDTVAADRRSIRQGLARECYVVASRKYDIVSDDVHFLGAVDLWKSLARQTLNYVYVWDSAKKEFLQDSYGQIIRYNGSNVADDVIWGNSENKILLILRHKPL